MIATAAIAALLPLTAPPSSAAAETQDAPRSLSAADVTAVDSGSDQIRYTGAWESTSSAGDHSGSVRYLSSDGSASYAFSGTSVAWITRLTPSSGTTRVSIDGKPVATVDGYAKEPVHKHPAFISDTLATGEHTITLARTGQKNPLSSGTNTIVDGFAVTGAPDATPAPAESQAPEPTEAPAPVPAPETTAAPEATQLEAAPDTGRVGLGSYENTSSSVNYSGDWRTLESGSDSGGSSRYLNSTGSASISFTGTAIRWVSRVTPSSGIANVYIDGNKVASVDRYSKTTTYQKVVFERTGLSNSTHSIKIVWTGNANSASAGTNLILDRFVVPDVAAPAMPTGVTAYNASGAVGVKWNAGSSDVAGYRVYSVSSTGAYSLIGQTSKSQTSFGVRGVPSYQTLSYSVTAVDSSGNESGKAAKASIKTGVTPVGSYRYDNCPPSTVTVHNAAELEKAAAAAKPGNVIKLAAGKYYGQMNLTVNGAAGKPVWICGPRDAVIDGTGISKGKSPIDLSNSSHVVLTGFKTTNGLKGVTVRSSHHVTVSDLLVENIGYEGVHLRSNTTDSVVVGNTIRKTGLLTGRFGEGVYIGSSDANWCNLTDCKPDRSDRNAVVDNTISLTTAELIEAKEGTTGGVIRGNTVDGTNAMANSDSWIMVSGNAWSVTSNTGKNSSQHGLRVSAHVDGWGKGNVFAKNSATVNAPGFGFKLYEPNGARSTGTLVSCSNTVSGAGSGFGTVSCTH
ncbi:MAG TPA: right-handed parallel beta-helix repeat-containing protein [Glaciibacter sp.]|nr:right-handed parallel beta-helix repeat-containing protein [Glaciibacter sp.]